MTDFFRQLVKPSTLAYEPRQFSGDSNMFWLWRVEIDGKLFSKTVLPFQASEPRIERFGCTDCGVAGDGTGFYAVRKAANEIFWFAEELLVPDFAQDFANLPETFLFDSADYENVLGGLCSELPTLTASELRILITHGLPPESLALYMLPESSDDKSGSKLLAHAREAFSEPEYIGELQAFPKRVIEIRIGLDLPGVPECRWFLGVNTDGVSISFASNPKIPGWFSGPAIDRAFSSISRLLQCQTKEPSISDTEIWTFLRQVELGDITLSPEGAREPQTIIAGNVSYTASNGWNIVVFNDANEWDYIDEISTSDGRRITFAEVEEFYPELARYQPTEQISWLRYRIPGHLRTECARCRTLLKRNELRQHHLKCGKDD